MVTVFKVIHHMRRQRAKRQPSTTNRTRHRFKGDRLWTQIEHRSKIQSHTDTSQSPILTAASAAVAAA